VVPHRCAWCARPAAGHGGRGGRIRRGSAASRRGYHAPAFAMGASGIHCAPGQKPTRHSRSGSPGLPAEQPAARAEARTPSASACATCMTARCRGPLPPRNVAVALRRERCKRHGARRDVHLFVGEPNHRVSDSPPSVCSRVGSGAPAPARRSADTPCDRSTAIPSSTPLVKALQACVRLLGTSRRRAGNPLATGNA